MQSSHTIYLPMYKDFHWRKKSDGTAPAPLWKTSFAMQKRVQRNVDTFWPQGALQQGLLINQLIVADFLRHFFACWTKLCIQENIFPKQWECIKGKVVWLSTFCSVETKTFFAKSKDFPRTGRKKCMISGLECLANFNDKVFNFIWLIIRSRFTCQ